MKSYHFKHNNFIFYYKKVCCHKIGSNEVSISDFNFYSKILTFFISESASIFAYAISSEKSSDKIYQELDIATEYLATRLSRNDSLIDLVTINPGLIVDWKEDESEKIISILSPGDLFYDKTHRKVIPANSRVGFLYQKTDKYISNCQFCKLKNCSFRSVKFDEQFVKRIYTDA